MEPFFCVLSMKCLLKCPYSKKPVLSQKMPGCAPVTLILTFHPNFHPNSLVFAFLLIHRKLINDNISLPSKHSSWWRRLFKTNMFALVLRRQKTPLRHLQDVLVKTNILVLDIPSSRRLQDFFKTSSSCPGDVLPRCLQDIFKTSWKTSPRHLQDVFKTFSRKLFLLTRLWKAFNTFLSLSFPKTIIYRGIWSGNTNSDKFMVSVQNLQER